MGDRFPCNAIVVYRGTISSPYITRITRRGAPKASHTALEHAEKKEQAKGTKEMEGDIRRRDG